MVDGSAPPVDDASSPEGAAPPTRKLSLSERAAAQARTAAAANAPYLDGLNDAQRAAVEALDGPVLMLAGAGTGKTRALTARLAHLLATGRCQPNEILAVTFTNKAAREMRERVRGFVGGAVEGMPWLGTFHSISAKLLRRHAELVGLQSNFTILDTDDQLRLLKQLIQAREIDDKRWPARQMAGLIDHWKNRGWTPERLPEGEGDAFAAGQGAPIYAEYQERLRVLNACDFGDLLLHCLTIFQSHADVLEKYRRWFRYILVDEYQDTNVAQYLWLRLLAGGDPARANICCVGDDDQSIYGWRGAEVGNILRFEKDFPGAQVIRLEQNYRSTQHILGAAAAVISANKDRLGKTLWTEADGGEKVRLIGHWDGEEEARWIGEEIEAAQSGTRGRPARSLDDMAILVRASHQMRAFEDRFLTIGLPYRVIGGPRFYERQEIRDALAYLRVVASPEDGLAFERIVNVPRRGVGDKALAGIQAVARQENISLYDAARQLTAESGLRGKAGKELAALLDSFDRWRRWLGKLGGEQKVIEAGMMLDLSPNEGPEPPLNHVELAERVLDESGYTAMWRADKSPDAPGRLDNLKEFVRSLAEHESLVGFLEHVSLVMENEQAAEGAKVSIMSLHAAKGLEFPLVFLPGWEEGLFPSQRSLDESGQKGLEEERRLAYVGVTRAEQELTISFAANRRIYNQWQTALPSRFIDELAEEHVEILTPPGLYGGAFGGAGIDDLDGVVRGSMLEERARNSSPYASPGWSRLKKNAGRDARRALRSPQEVKNLVIDAQALSAFSVDQRVFHEKFGYGAITAIEGDKLTVEFDKAGQKRVVAGYLKDAA
ncbi:MAG: UvrD-helicase domain-containing protein [Pseudomonadota bacterium]